MTQTAMVKIKNASDDVVLQKEQKRFNKLTTDISKRRQQLLELQDAITKFKTGYVTEIVPVEKKHAELVREMIFLADKYFDDKTFNKTDRKRLVTLIDDAIGGMDDEYVNDQLKDIFARRVGADFDEVVNESNAYAIDMTKDFINDMFGLDIECDDPTNPDEFMQKLRQKLEANEEQERLAAEQKPKRKKSAKTLAKEAREKEAEELQGKSIREVYRQLAKALHPDRIANDENYESKNMLMQQVNAAYDKGDLLTLLEIQLKIEQIDQDNIDGVALDKLKHFNVVLKKQLDELSWELNSEFSRFKMEFPDLEIYGAIEAKKIVYQLKMMILETKQQFNDFKAEFKLWQQDIKSFRTYIREVVDLREPKDDLMAEMEMMRAIFPFEGAMKQWK